MVVWKEETMASGRVLGVCLAALLVTVGFAGCLSGGSGNDIAQTGSSTVLPLAERWADDFEGARVSVSGGGSSHGLNSLLTGKADLGDASRKISKGDYEKVGCSVSQSDITAAQTGPHPWQYPACNGVTPTEWPVAYDALVVVVNPNNDWIGDGLTYEQLGAIFTSENTAERWDEVPGLDDAPAEEIDIFAPDEASGTYTYFFEEIAGNEDKSLLAAGSDRYSPSADDNVILTAIANTEHAIGFFGLAYYIENDDRVNAVGIQNEEMETYVAPSFGTAGEYPITRPIHIYTDGVPNGSDEKSQALRAYLSYALSDDGQASVPEVGYIKVSDIDPESHQSMQEALDDA